MPHCPSHPLTPPLTRAAGIKSNKKSKKSSKAKGEGGLFSVRARACVRARPQLLLPLERAPTMRSSAAAQTLLLPAVHGALCMVHQAACRVPDPETL